MSVENFRSSHRTEAPEPHESQEGIPQMYKAGGAIAVGVLRAGLAWLNKRDYDKRPVIERIFKSDEAPNHPEVEKRGWIGAMVNWSAEAYKNIDDVDSLIKGDYENVLRRQNKTDEA